MPGKWNFVTNNSKILQSRISQRERQFVVIKPQKEQPNYKQVKDLSGRDRHDIAPLSVIKNTAITVQLTTHPSNRVIKGAFDGRSLYDICKDQKITWIDDKFSEFDIFPVFNAFHVDIFLKHLVFFSSTDNDFAIEQKQEIFRLLEENLDETITIRYIKNNGEGACVSTILGDIYNEKSKNYFSSSNSSNEQTFKRRLEYLKDEQDIPSLFEMHSNILIPSDISQSYNLGSSIYDRPHNSDFD